MTKRPRIRWAPRLRPALLKRLYDADARGIRDEELCEEVGARLHARCHTFLLVSRGEVECPACAATFRVERQGETRCPACAWSTTYEEYHRSKRHHEAFTGRAVAAFLEFHDSYPRARSYGERIVRIDQLIHSFHHEEKTGAPVKSVASKLLEGNKDEVVRFLDRLSGIDPERKQAWRRTVSGTIHGRLVRADGEEE